MHEGIGYGSSGDDSPTNSEPTRSKADAWPEHLNVEQQEEAIARMFKQLIGDSGSRPQEARRAIDQLEQRVRTRQADEGLGIRLDTSA